MTNIGMRGDTNRIDRSGSSLVNIPVLLFRSLNGSLLMIRIDNICFYNSGNIKATYKDDEKLSINNSKFIVDDDFCVSPESEKIRLRFEGLGDKTKISPVD